MTTSQAVGIEQEVARTNAAIRDALGRGDAAAIAALYTEDAVACPPNHPLVRGRDAIQALWGGLLKQGHVEASLRTTELHVDGEATHEIGAYDLRIQPASGPTITDVGKYAATWRRENGALKLATDIWNSDLPAPAAPPSPRSDETAAVVQRHLEAFEAGDLERIMADYAENALICTPSGPARGVEQIRQMFIQMLPLLPSGATTFEKKEPIVDGEFEYFTSSVSSPLVDVPLAGDTFVVRDGKIVFHSFVGQFIPKAQ